LYKYYCTLLFSKCKFRKDYDDRRSSDSTPLLFLNRFCKSTVCPTTTASDDAIDGLEYSPLVDVNNDDNSSVDAEEVFDGVSQLLGEFSVEKSNADVRSSDMGHNGTIKTDNTGDAV
jgi:hypothetical protein